PPGSPRTNRASPRAGRRRDRGFPISGRPGWAGSAPSWHAARSPGPGRCPPRRPHLSAPRSPARASGPATPSPLGPSVGTFLDLDRLVQYDAEVQGPFLLLLLPDPAVFGQLRLIRLDWLARWERDALRRRLIAGLHEIR